MPKPLRRNTKHIEDGIRAWTQFEAGWQRSRKGNLWKEFDGMTVTIFRRGGSYKWSVADNEGVQFSQECYEDESDAMASLGEFLGVWV